MLVPTAVASFETPQARSPDSGKPPAEKRFLETGSASAIAPGKLLQWRPGEYRCKWCCSSSEWPNQENGDGTAWWLVDVDARKCADSRGDLDPICMIDQSLSAVVAVRLLSVPSEMQRGY